MFHEKESYFHQYHNFSANMVHNCSHNNMIHAMQESAILGRRVEKTAERISRRLNKQSMIVVPSRELTIPRLHRNEIRVSKLLGRGGFNNVYEVSDINLMEQTPLADVQEARRRNLATQASKRTFAIKFLSHNTMNNPDRYISGASDLVMESKLLANLSHPNIVSLHGMSSDGTAGFRHSVEGNFFILIDKLDCTLLDVIDTWKLQNDRLGNESPLNREHSLQNPDHRELFLQRLKVATTLSKAITYLHSNNIIFRDLKGENIGFDINGTLKLFDFGLAKELNQREGLSDGTYTMSGMTGTQRYMAPEVMSHKSYNLSADTYSYCVVMWEVFSLQQAYSGMGSAHHFHFVVECDGRPSVDPAWPCELSTLLITGWHADIQKRPQMSEICRVLERYTESAFQANKSLQVPVHKFPRNCERNLSKSRAS